MQRRASKRRPRILIKMLKGMIKGLFALLVLVPALAAGAVEVPQLRARVNDTAGMISPAAEQQLEQSLQSFEASQSTQIVVVTIPSLEGEALEDFSMRMAEAWKIGQKDSDNGAILLVAKNERKIRIEVGYGLEGRLTDLIAGRIIRQVISPAFKDGNFDMGFIGGVNAMMEAVRGEFAAPPSRNPAAGADRLSGWFLPLIAFVFIITQLGRVARLLGTVAGGVLLPVFGSLFFSGGVLLLLALIPAGVIAGFLLSLVGAFLGGPSRGRGGITPGGFRGGFHGGGFGGGFSGGSFGGGGGGFGGGGASGGW